MLVVCNHETDFMQLCGPTQQPAFALQQTLSLDLLEQRQGGLAHSPTLVQVYMVSLHQFEYGDCAAVLVKDPADQVV